MARLFITPREINFINDIAKEVIKDVIGQKIYLFQISEIKSKVHDVYEESPDKVFETPIELDCLVKYNEQEIRTNRFGSEEYYTIEAYIQSRDLLDKGIEILEGDFFSYGSTFFEIIKAPLTQTIFGQIEHKRFITITGRQARKEQFLSRVFGPTSEEYSDADAQQNQFIQQRGYQENAKGKTGDIRDLQKNGVLEKPISGPKEVSSRGDSTNVGSSFYDDE
tara:strand:+ start:378 stop:1043 length:666 start_codon:yes stop_codon:yes gene_type:complete